MRCALFFVVFTCCVAVFSASTTGPTTTEPPTTTISPQAACSLKTNTSCADCLAAGTGCYYCSASRRCGYYPYKRLIPSHDECAYFSEVYWGVCFISLQGGVIAIGVVVGTVLLAILVCCCWCCCRKSKNSKWLRDMARLEEERRQRQERSDDRRAERKARTDDIRRKYGLVRDETPYTRFDH